MNRVAMVLCSLVVTCAWPASRADACTYVDVKAKDGTVAVGRSIEWGFPMAYTFTVVPRGQAFTALYPADKVAKGFQPLSWTSRYAYAGVGVTVQQGLDSAQNEVGLNVEGLNLPGFTEFPTVTPADGCVLSLGDIGDWLMGNFATVKEVREALARCTVWTPAVAAQGSATIHLAITDRTGAGIVVEWVGGKQNIHDNVTHTMTNSPPYDWHLTNLRNFLTLDPKDVAASQREGYTLRQLSTGDGMTGLPGDFKSASRFVKVSVLRSFAAPVDTADEACSLAGHIINTVDIPRGSVDSGLFEGKPALETAQVTLVKDLTNNRIFVSDYAHRLAYVAVDLKKLFAQNRKIGPVLFKDFVNRGPVDVTEALR